MKTCFPAWLVHDVCRVSLGSVGKVQGYLNGDRLPIGVDRRNCILHAGILQGIGEIVVTQHCETADSFARSVVEMCLIECPASCEAVGYI